jgi:prepilin-type N-terminal cleavage/methylation domain-containing protein
MRNIIKKRNKQGGFSFVELVIALVIVAILVAVVILVTQGFFSKARESALDGDLHSVQTAVDTYAIQSGKWPTANGSLPPQGNASIDFNASFNKEGKTMSFYPHFISRLPKHSDEEVWRINNAARVSVDMPRDKY